MRIESTINGVRESVKQARLEGKSVGFVPTMGYLHEGHLSLINEARKLYDYVVLSIFVNPLQFGENEDFSAYPRSIERDEQLAKETGVDVIFYPDVKEMYPTETTMTIKVERGVDVLCGASRPGHFDGVATVVMKLFQIVRADGAFFGEKDAQQVAVIINMVSMFNIPITIHPCPTVREEDGLAKSSRNVYLSEEERAEAPFIYESLKAAAQAVKSGLRHRQEIIQIVTEKLNSGRGAIDYVDVLTYPQLEVVQELPASSIVIAVAYQYEKARLIDNYLLTLD